MIRSITVETTRLCSICGTVFIKISCRGSLTSVTDRTGIYTDMTCNRFTYSPSYFIIVRWFSVKPDQVFPINLFGITLFFIFIFISSLFFLSRISSKFLLTQYFWNVWNNKIWVEVYVHIVPTSLHLGLYLFPHFLILT